MLRIQSVAPLHLNLELDGLTSVECLKDDAISSISPMNSLHLQHITHFISFTSYSVSTLHLGVAKADILCRSHHVADRERNTINSTNTKNTTKTYSSTSLNSISRRLLQHVPFCSSDPCPGMMNRNPSSCACECEMIESCPGNQVWNEPICQCGCSTTPTCIAPLTFNPVQVSLYVFKWNLPTFCLPFCYFAVLLFCYFMILLFCKFAIYSIQCGCECPVERACPLGQVFNAEICDCEILETASICPSDPYVFSVPFLVSLYLFLSLRVSVENLCKFDCIRVARLWYKLCFGQMSRGSTAP